MRCRPRTRAPMTSRTRPQRTPRSSPCAAPEDHGARRCSTSDARDRDRTAMSRRSSPSVRPRTTSGRSSGSGLPQAATRTDQHDMPALNRVAEVWFVVSGEDKAQAVAARRSRARARYQVPAAGRRHQHDAVDARLGRRQPAAGQPAPRLTPGGSPRRGHREVETRQKTSPDLRWSRSVLQRLVQDVLGLLVAAPLLHVRQVGLVRLDLRRRRRVLASPGWRAGRSAGSPSVSGICASTANVGTVSCPCEQKYDDALPRRRIAALGLAHRSGADPAATDGAAT